MKIISFNKNYQKELVEFLDEVLNKEWGSYVSQDKDPDLFSVEDIYIKNGGNFWLSLNKENNIIGTIAIKIFKLKDKKIAYLKRFYLKKEYRKQGIGKKMLNTTFDFCQNNKINEIVLGTNPESERAIELFRKAGFENFEIYPDLPTFDDEIFMRRVI